MQTNRTADDGFKMGGMSPSVAAGASHHSALTPQLAKGKEKLSDALKSCNEILKELFSKKHSVSVNLLKQNRRSNPELLVSLLPSQP